MRVTQITLTTNPSGNTGSFNFPATPLNAGTYTAGFDPGQHLNDISWSIVFTMAAVPDYDITYANNTYIVTNNTNHADTLTVSEPGAGNIKFAAPGRTFSVNGTPASTNDSGSLILGSITAITINGGSGGETFNVAASAARRSLR